MFPDWVYNLFSRTPSQPLDVEDDVKDPCNFHVTLWPQFDHFPRFSKDSRIQGLRLNSAMMHASEINDTFVSRIGEATVPLWFDIKGMQLRIKEVISDPTDPNWDHLEFVLNRPVHTKTPFIVEFKAGEDRAKCVEIKNGTHFIFEHGGPKMEVRAGESIHIRQPHHVGGDVFLDYELEKIAKVVKLGFKQFYLSYVWDWSHVQQFRDLIGPDAELVLKIENKLGLDWVADHWMPCPNTHLAAARGDLYVEVDYPHQIMNACKAIIEADPTAFVGSRMLLSMVTSKTPRAADFSDLAWLWDIGYRNFLLCDELCLREDLLGRCVSVFDAFRREYVK